MPISFRIFLLVAIILITVGGFSFPTFLSKSRSSGAVYGWWPSNTKDASNVWGSYYEKGRANATADEKSEEELQEEEQQRQWEEEQRAFQDHVEAHHSDESAEEMQPEGDVIDHKIKETEDGVLQKGPFIKDTMKANSIEDRLEKLISSRWPSRFKNSEQDVSSFEKKITARNPIAEKDSRQQQNGTYSETDGGIVENFENKMLDAGKKNSPSINRENEPIKKSFENKESTRESEKNQLTHNLADKILDDDIELEKESIIDGENIASDNIPFASTEGTSEENRSHGDDENHFLGVEQIAKNSSELAHERQNQVLPEHEVDRIEPYSETEKQKSWEEEQRVYQEYQQTYHLTQELYETQLKVDQLTRDLKQKDDQITSLETRLGDISETTDVLLEKIFKENMELRTTLHSLQDWETMKVTWEIPYFERRLTESEVLFHSDEFMIGGYILNLELSVMKKNRGGEESDRSVNFYFNHISGCNIMPIEMDGSTLTLISTDTNQNLEYVASGDDFSIESEACGIGWSRMATLGDMCKRYLSVQGSVKIEALVRVHRSRNCNGDKRINDVTPDSYLPR